MITKPVLPRFMILICSIFVLGTATNFVFAQEQGKLNLAHIPEEAFAAVVLHPQSLLAKPEFELFPLEVIEAGGKQEFGFNPLEIELAIGFVYPPMPGTPEQGGVVLHFSEPQQLGGQALNMTKPAEFDGVKILASPRPIRSELLSV